MRRVFYFVATLLVPLLILTLVQSYLLHVYAQSGNKLQLLRYATYTYNTLHSPTAIIYDANAPFSPQLYIADSGNHVIRAFSISGGLLSVMLGTVGTSGYINGSNASVLLNHPTGLRAVSHYVVIPRVGTYHWVELYINDASNYVVRHMCSGSVPPGNVCNQTQTIAGNNQTGYLDGANQSAEFSVLGGMNQELGIGLMADTGNNAIRSSDGTNVTTYAGTGFPGFVNGYRTSAQFSAPMQTARDAAGTMYVADSGNSVIRKIDPSSGNVTTFAGTGQEGYVDGSGSVAEFQYPSSVVYNPSDGYIYVADSWNNVIRRISSSGIVSTYAGTGAVGLADGALTQAKFNCPMDLAIGSGFLYVSDMANNAIRRIDMTAGVVSTYIN